MTAEANRAVGNLLLLCIEHADEVDRPERIHLYPVTLLQEWKEQQLAFFDVAGNGWSITEQEADEVIRESTRLEISIQGHVVNLGGGGGQAPGAGGGSGAAIGYGVKGAPGGAGGPININIRGEDGGAPGAGGGGSGYIPPTSPLFWQGSGRAPTFGLWSFLGVDGQPGGVSSFTGDHGVSVAARGGEGGLVGTGNRSNSDTLAASALILANYVEFRENFAYISGACFQFYDVLNLGDRLTFTGMVTLEGGGVSAGEYSLTIATFNPANDAKSSVTLVFEITQSGDMLRMCFRF
jgi:hypothetical protein